MKWCSTMSVPRCMRVRKPGNCLSGLCMRWNFIPGNWLKNMVLRLHWHEHLLKPHASALRYQTCCTRSIRNLQKLYLKVIRRPQNPFLMKPATYLSITPMGPMCPLAQMFPCPRGLILSMPSSQSWMAGISCISLWVRDIPTPAALRNLP